MYRRRNRPFSVTLVPRAFTPYSGLFPSFPPLVALSTSLNILFLFQNPNMNNVIFENPSKQPSRIRKASYISQPRGERVPQNQQRSTGNPGNDEPGRYGHDINDTGPDQLMYERHASLGDLFDLSEGDERSVNYDATTSFDSLFSSKKDNERAIESEISVESASERMSKSISSEHPFSGNATARTQITDRQTVFSFSDRSTMDEVSSMSQSIKKRRHSTPIESSSLDDSEAEEVV